MRFAKETGTAVVVVGHVTKGGGIAGPKTLEHIVDTVLYFEGEVTLDYRLLRTTKNRFGSVDELGVFSHDRARLVAVPNPSAVFLAARAAGISGSAVTALMEGTRPVLVEVQALAAKSGYGTPQRVATGLDPKRLAVLLAVLERRAATSFADLDVFVQVTAGVRLTEPGADLAVAAALLISLTTGRRRPMSIFLGEIGLGGEIRPGGGRRAADRGGGAARDSGGVFGSSRATVAGAPASRWWDSTTSSSWCARLPRDVGVVVVAAGRSSRVGGDVPKQYLPHRRRADAAPGAAAVRQPTPRCRARGRRPAAGGRRGTRPSSSATLHGSSAGGGGRRRDAGRLGARRGSRALRAECRVVLVHDGGPAVRGPRRHRRGDRATPGRARARSRRCR